MVKMAVFAEVGLLQSQSCLFFTLFYFGITGCMVKMAVFAEVGLLQSQSCLFFTLFYFVIIADLVFPPDEFISAGVTIECIFDSWLGSENVDFFRYHIRRTCLTVVLHAFLPLGYVAGISYVSDTQTNDSWSLVWIAIFSVTIIIPTLVLWKVLEWSHNNWEKHPISQQLKVFSNPNIPWTAVAADINEEYRRLNKINLRLSSIVRVIATDNWILKVSPYKVNVSFQPDTTLTVKSADMHQMTPSALEEVQFVNIEVKSTRHGVEPFTIRLNALDLKELQDRISRPITIPQEIRIHKTLTDRFLETFSREISLNPVYETYEDLEFCIGCMQVPANVKLQKLCLNSEVSGVCTTCYCKPMWCAECMGKWFASRQEGPPRTWLSSKCTCPMCRAKFCILDVSKVVQLSR